MAVVNLNQLNLELNNLAKRVDFTATSTAALQAAEKYSAITQSKLGTEINQIIGGFQSITQEVDQAVGEVSSVANSGISLLVENPNGINIRKSTSSSNSDLQAITESTTTGGFLVAAVSANTPEAIFKTLQQVTGQSPNTISRAVQPIASSTTQLQSALADIAKGNTIANQLVTESSKYLNNLTSEIGGIIEGVIDNVVESLVSPYSAVFNVITNKVLPDSTISEVIGLVRADQIKQAAAILKSFSDLSTEEIENLLLTIPNSVSEQLTEDIDQEPPDEIIKIIGERV